MLLKYEIILKSQQRFKSEAHNVYTEEINKISQIICKMFTKILKNIIQEKIVSDDMIADMINKSNRNRIVY